MREGGTFDAFVGSVLVVGVVIYLIARGSSIQDRAQQKAVDRGEALDGYVQAAAGSTPADELERLQRLREAGAIDDAEFQQMKAKVLAG